MISEVALATVLLLGGIGLGRILSCGLYSVTPHDPATAGAVAALLAAVALLACWQPLRRATTINPMMALRRE